VDITEKGLNLNHLKIVAIIAMTIDNFTSVIFPNYPTNSGILQLHMVGRHITDYVVFYFRMVLSYA